MYFMSIATLFLISFNLQGSSNVPCSSFLTECFQLCSSPLFSFFHFAQPFQGSLVSFVCQRSNLVYLFFISSVFPPVPFQISGRDPLVVVECCNATRPLCQVSSSFSLLLPCHLLACCILSCHHVHCIIMFSKLVFVRVPPVPSVVLSEPNHTHVPAACLNSIL